MAVRQRPSVFAQHKQVRVDDRAANPLVDDYCQVVPHMSAHRGNAPRLFGTSDLPPFTASGNPPSALNRLPWQLRHAAAEADQAEWARLFNEYADDRDADGVMLMFEQAVDHFGNHEYRARVHDWASGR